MSGPQPDAPTGATRGWNPKVAWSILGFLMVVAVLVMAIAVRMFDRFDLVTELLICAVFLVIFFGANAGVIMYLSAMDAGDASESKITPSANAGDLLGEQQ